MNLRSKIKAACILCGLLFVSPLHAQQNRSALTWLESIRSEVIKARSLAAAGNTADAQNAIVRVYMDEYEPFEQFYGSTGKYAAAEVSPLVAKGEALFHDVMQASDAAVMTAHAQELETQLANIGQAVSASGVTQYPNAAPIITGNKHLITPDEISSPELKAIVAQLNAASQAYAAGDRGVALQQVEHLYLEKFEPIESRLPRGVVDNVHKIIHLQLRPAIRQQLDAQTVTSLLADIGAQVKEADRFLAKGNNVWFAVVNSFVIIVREGLEAVLLIAALLAYLTAIGAQAKHRRQIYTGMAAGVVASMGTWFIASTLLPFTGANRELLEGFTALASVVVLLYVAHWLFQKTYIHDWKEYLRSHLGDAVTRGSAMAMATLAFAAVYREGFETVLFYQALSLDAGVGAVLGGFIPGALLITAVGVAIIRAGVKLPLKKVFTMTNAVLMYLAFVFIGKGLYNLQEGGLYAVHPLPMPSHPALEQLLGFYPTVETLSAQLVFVLLLSGTYVYYRRKIRKLAPVQQNAQPPAQPAVARPA